MPRALSATTAIYWLTGLTTLEVLAQTYGFLLGYPSVASVLYLFSGLGIALLPICRWESDSLPAPAKRNRWILPILLTIIIAYILWRTPSLISAVPLDYRQADMLPVIETMGLRRLSGEAVYAPIEAIWGGMQPIYLPAMWLPYMLGSLLELDIRWISTLAIVGSLCLITLGQEGLRGGYSNQWRPVVFVPILLLIAYIYHFYSTLFTLSEEPVVVFYYVLLAWGLIRSRPLITGMAMALCLLSRYSLAFWVPMYILFQYIFQSRKDTYLTASALTVSLVLLLTLGEAWDQLPQFLQLQDAYLDNLLDESSNWGLRAQIASNPGLIKFLPFAGIALWHRLLIYGSLLVPFLSLAYFFYHRQWLDARFFGLCSLKLCLVYFFNLLTIPYSYLFYPSTFLSVFILAAVISIKKKQMEENFSIGQPVG